ncbi:MAG: hypothetical protein IPK83_17170 [Planctomycetes bacterium]|nr:hypothetical protein [Planctomycetota bacterium]
MFIAQQLALHCQRFARELGIHRETVARYVDLARGDFPKPAISMTGSEAREPCPFDVELPVREGFGGQDSLTTDSRSGPKPAISIAGSAGRRSHCEPYRAVIMEALERGLTAQRILQSPRRRTWKAA